MEVQEAVRRLRIFQLVLSLCGCTKHKERDHVVRGSSNERVVSTVSSAAVSEVKQPIAK